MGDGHWTFRRVFSELKRRRVLSVAATYAVVGWIVIQVSYLVFPALLLPSWATRAVVILVLVGFVPAVVLAWLFDVVPDRGNGDASEASAGRAWRWYGGLVTAAVVVVLLATGWIVRATSGGPANGAMETEAAGRMDASNAPGTELDPYRVAVLYFDHRGEDSLVALLGDWLTESLIDELSGVPQLHVVSINGVRPYRDDSTMSPDSLNRALGAGSLVKGTVSTVGDRVRVNVRLVDAASQTIVASDTLSSPAARASELAGDLTARVSDFLRRQLGVRIRAQEQRAEAHSLRAVQLVQQAKELVARKRQLVLSGDTAGAIRVLQHADSLAARAETLDPSWVEPIRQRGWIALEGARNLGTLPSRPDSAWVERGMRHAHRVLELKPLDPEGLALQGALRFALAESSDSVRQLKLFDSAESDLRQAVALRPSMARAWATLADLLSVRGGHMEEAAQAADSAWSRDAFLDNASQVLTMLVQTELELGHFDEVHYWAEMGRRRFPDMVNFPAAELAALLVEVPADTPMIERGWRLAREIERLGPKARARSYAALTDMQMAAVLARTGLVDSARSVMRRVRESDPEDSVKYAYYEAYARLMVGDRRRAIELLRDRIHAGRDTRSYLATDPLFKDLRGDPRFQQLVGELESDRD